MMERRVKRKSGSVGCPLVFLLRLVTKENGRKKKNPVAELVAVGERERGDSSRDCGG